MGQFTINKSQRSLWKRKLLQNRLFKYNLLKISNIPYNLICTTKCNDSSFLITIISCHYLNLSLTNEYVRLFVCVTVGDSIIKMDMVEISLTSLIPSHCYACPKPGFELRHMLWSFLCDQWIHLRWVTIVRCVDIGEIVDHHCLKFSFHNSDTNLSVIKICISWICRIIKL